jgi:hypothetical protein
MLARGGVLHRFFLKSYMVMACLMVGFAAHAQAPEKLIYHDVKVDSEGHILPWYSENLARSYDHVIDLTWNFWDNIRTDLNGLPYYMNHQVWRPKANDPRGIGGDQIQMALSSWQLLYAYSGNERVKQNMKFMADYYLTHSLSPAASLWPNLPFPYNTLVNSGVYDGDMVMGYGYLQPDKAGSFGLELVHLYKMTTKDNFFQATSMRYLHAAEQIALTLAANMKEGDGDTSPLPFRVNAFTGEIGFYKHHAANGSTWVTLHDYTTNWAPTLELFLELQQLDPAHEGEYRSAFQALLKWMKLYPLKTHRWGPFFEDVPGNADTQINAITFARFILTHREYFEDWQTLVPSIFDWVYRVLGNTKWQKYGVVVVNEQTSNLIPGQSHVARQAETELLFGSLIGDRSRETQALRQLSWATYAVDEDGKSCFPEDEPWMTDGYGDFVRHYLRAMATLPQIAPGDVDHLLSSTSVIQQVDYQGQFDKFALPNFKVPDLSKVQLFYRAYDSTGTELIRMTHRPITVVVGGEPVSEVPDLGQQGYRWTDMSQNGGGGLLEIRREAGHEVIVVDDVLTKPKIRTILRTVEQVHNPRTVSN